MDFYTKVRNRALSGVLTAYDGLLRKLPSETLSDDVAARERSVALSCDQTPRLERLLDAPIRYLDVGARSGLPRFIAHYGDWIRSTLVEPEPVEAARLRSLGYEVIQRALGREPGEMDLLVTAQPGASSLLSPNPAIDRYLTNRHAKGDTWEFADRRKIVRTERVSVTTVEALATEAGSPFDYVKLDTQGSEYEILEGFGDAKPLFITTEISLVEFYAGQRTFYDIGKRLYDAGYMMYAFDVRRMRPGGARIEHPELPGLPLHGDAAFMPDWSRPAGQALLAGRELPFAALALILGLEQVLRFTLEALELPGRSRIEQALALPIAGYFEASGFLAERPVR